MWLTLKIVEKVRNVSLWKPWYFYRTNMLMKKPRYILQVSFCRWKMLLFYKSLNTYTKISIVYWIRQKLYNINRIQYIPTFFIERYHFKHMLLVSMYLQNFECTMNGCTHCEFSDNCILYNFHGKFIMMIYARNCYEHLTYYKHLYFISTSSHPLRIHPFPFPTRH